MKTQEAKRIDLFDTENDMLVVYGKTRLFMSDIRIITLNDAGGLVLWLKCQPSVLVFETDEANRDYFIREFDLFHTNKMNRTQKKLQQAERDIERLLKEKDVD